MLGRNGHAIINSLANTSLKLEQLDQLTQKKKRHLTRVNSQDTYSWGESGLPHAPTGSKVTVPVWSETASDSKHGAVPTVGVSQVSPSKATVPTIKFGLRRLQIQNIKLDLQLE